MCVLCWRLHPPRLVPWLLAQGEDIPPGSERDYPANRFCERCLAHNYNYTEEDWRTDFVCPRCKGLDNPNKRCALRIACSRMRLLCALQLPARR